MKPIDGILWVEVLSVTAADYAKLLIERGKQFFKNICVTCPVGRYEIYDRLARPGVSLIGSVKGPATGELASPAYWAKVHEFILHSPGDTFVFEWETAVRRAWEAGFWKFGMLSAEFDQLPPRTYVFYPGLPSTDVNTKQHRISRSDFDVELLKNIASENNIYLLDWATRNPQTADGSRAQKRRELVRPFYSRPFPVLLDVGFRSDRYHPKDLPNACKRYKKAPMRFIYPGWDLWLDVLEELERI